MSRENVEAVLRALRGWNDGAVEAWLQDVHPKAEWRSAIARRMEGSDAVHRGHRELRQFWEEWHSVWDVTIQVAETRDLGDTVVALGRMRTRGEASGVDLESPVGYVFVFEDGLVRKATAFMGHAEALEAVGLSE